MKGDTVEFLGKDGAELYKNMEYIFRTKSQRILIDTANDGKLIGRLVNFESGQGFNLAEVVRLAPIKPEVVECASVKPEEVRESYLIY